MQTILEKIKIFFQCKVTKCHNWTTNAEEGIPATQNQLNNGIDGFFDYARMYCKDCGKISVLSEPWEDNKR